MQSFPVIPETFTVLVFLARLSSLTGAFSFETHTELSHCLTLFASILIKTE